jgi:hypothetical protein
VHSRILHDMLRLRVYLFRALVKKRDLLVTNDSNA